MHHDGLTFNRTPHFLVYADDFLLHRENINTLHKNTKALLDILKRVGPEVNTETTYHVNTRSRLANRRYSVVTYRQLIRRLDM